MMENLAIPSFIFGLLSAASPCVFPLYPGFLAYLAGHGADPRNRSRYFLGVFVLLGVLTTMLALGGILAGLAWPVGSLLRYLIPLADLLIFLLGVALLLDRNPFTAMPQIRVPVLRHPFINAFLYGMMYGPITLPCSGPLAVAIFALSFTVEEAAGKLWIFLWFGLGIGLPLLILSLFTGVAQRQWIGFFTRHRRIINVFGGVLMMAVAIYDIVANWEMLRLAFA